MAQKWRTTPERAVYLRGAELAAHVSAALKELPDEFRERRSRIERFVSDLFRREPGIKRLDLRSELGWFTYEATDVQLSTKEALELLGAHGHRPPAGEFAGMNLATWVNTLQMNRGYGSADGWATAIAGDAGVTDRRRRALAGALHLVELSLVTNGSLPDGASPEAHLLLSAIVSTVTGTLGVSAPTPTELVLIAVATGIEGPGQDHAVLVDRWRKRARRAR